MGEMSRCVVLGAGPAENIAALRSLLHEDDYCIAADGGLLLAECLSLKPAAVVADMDSLMQTPPNGMDVVRLPVRKNMTDMAAAVQYGLDAGYTDFLLLGGTGGRLDHQYANIQLLVRLAKKGCTAVLADARNTITAITRSPYTVSVQPDWSLSLFAFGEPVTDLSIQNADYELDHYTLFPDDSLCVSNAVTQCPCTVSFTRGVLLLYRSKD